MFVFAALSEGDFSALDVETEQHRLAIFEEKMRREVAKRVAEKGVSLCTVCLDEKANCA